MTTAQQHINGSPQLSGGQSFGVDFVLPELFSLCAKQSMVGTLLGGLRSSGSGDSIIWVGSLSSSLRSPSLTLCRLTILVEPWI